jgi:hypothetical protein
MSENKNQDNRSASQKISDLETAYISLYQAMDNLNKDLNTVKEALKILGNKTDAIVKASSSGQPLSDDLITKIMIDNNAEELAQKVRIMIAQGIIAPADQAADDSFLVGSEVNDLGETVNPRLQFAVYAVAPELREKFVGAKSGDVLNLQEGKLKFKVAEIYQIQQQKPAEAAPATEAPATEAAPAPSAEAAPEAPVAQPDQSATPAT